MKINVIGGGPAGLYFAILMKKAWAEHDITVYERNRADDTFGFGVVFSDETLEHFAADQQAEASPAPGPSNLRVTLNLPRPSAAIADDFGAVDALAGRDFHLQLLALCLRRGRRRQFRQGVPAGIAKYLGPVAI